MGVAAGVPGTIEGVADGVSSVASENCVDEFPSSQRRGGAKRRGGQFGETVLAGLTTPSAPSLRSAHPPLLCEEGNISIHAYNTDDGTD